MNRHTALLSLAGILSVSSAARGDDEPIDRFCPDFLGHSVGWESIVVGAAALPALGFLLPQSHRGNAPDAAHLHDTSATVASDWMLTISLPLLTFGAAGAEALRDQGIRWEHLRAALVVGEAALAGATVSAFPKRIAGRCRPQDWSESQHACVPLLDDRPDFAYQAFWSGHTAPLAAAAGACSCLAMREGRWGWPAAVALAGEVATVTTGALRVAAGAHSWTDVGAGFAAGNALGIAACLVHPRTLSPGALTLQPTLEGVLLSGKF